MAITPNPLPPVINKIFSIIISIAMALSSFFLTLTFNTMRDMEARIHILEIDSAKVSSSRFTASDFVAAKANIDATQLQNEKRILVLEEQNKVVKELLFEIRADVAELKKRN